MKISIPNQSLIDASHEKAFQEGSVSAGSSVSVTVDDNNNFSQNDFVVIGEAYQPKTEIAKINALVSAGQTIQLDSLTFDHANEPILKIKYDKVKLYSATTLGGAKTAVETKDIDIDQEYTEFSLADDATGFYFFTFYNSETTVESNYSAGIEASQEQSNRSYSGVYDFVKIYYKEGLPYDTFDRLLQLALDETFSQHNFSFRERKASFTTTVGTYEYDIENDAGIDDFGILVSARTDDRMLHMISVDKDDLLALNNNVMTPYTICQWQNKFYVRVDQEETVYLRYLVRTESLLTSIQKTSMQLFSVLGYKILKMLFIDKDAQLSDRWELEYQKTLRLLKKADEKDLGVFTLAEDTGNKRPFITPQITEE